MLVHWSFYRLFEVMEHKLQRLSLLVGMLLYLYWSDIYVAVQYWKNDEFWWFGATLTLICIPSLIVNFTAIIQFMNIWSCTTAIAQLSIVARYIEALVEPRTSVGDFRLTYLLAILRYIETITESAPQWCLQVYIMFRQRSFPSYTVVSSVFSLLSLAWSIMTLEKERREKNNFDFDRTDVFVFSLKQSLTLVPRLFSIVVFAYVFRSYVFLALAVHWLTLMSMLYLIETSDGEDLGTSMLLSFLVSFPCLFHCPEHDLAIKKPKLEMRFIYAFLFIADMTMLILSLSEMPAIAHTIGITAIAIIFIIVVSIRYVSFISLYVLNDIDEDD